MACDSASTQTASHHGKDAKCDKPAGPSSGPQISGQSAHDCSTHDASMRQVSTTAAERADLSAKSALSTTGFPALASSSCCTTPRALFDDTVPQGTAPHPALGRHPRSTGFLSLFDCRITRLDKHRRTVRAPPCHCVMHVRSIELGRCSHSRILCAALAADRRSGTPRPPGTESSWRATLRALLVLTVSLSVLGSADRVLRRP